MTKYIKKYMDKKTIIPIIATIIVNGIVKSLLADNVIYLDPQVYWESVQTQFLTFGVGISMDFWVISTIIMREIEPSCSRDQINKVIMCISLLWIGASSMHGYIVAQMIWKVNPYVVNRGFGYFFVTYLNPGIWSIMSYLLFQKKEHEESEPQISEIE